MDDRDTMKAVVYHRYGSPDVLQMTEIQKPVPKDGEVLIRVHATSLNAYDWHLLRAAPFFTRFSSGLFRPRNKILGADIAGVVETAGQQFKPGNDVYGCLESCGKGGLAAGGLATYVCAKESVLAHKPRNATFEEAAALPMAAVTALQGLRDSGQLRPGQAVLINGASGGVGTFAVQIAKALGAEVTGVCGSGSVKTVRTLGADHVIDYSVEDFLKNGRQYDLMLDIAASRSVADYRRALKPGGVCVVVGFSTMRHMVQVGFAGLRSTEADGRRITLLMAKNTSQSDLLYLNELVEKGAVKPAIDRCYPLNEAAEAIRHLEIGHPKGKVVIRIAL
jgi:NADPH:quinone reductase-like Zn-dependent oxidoreductase